MPSICYSSRKLVNPVSIVNKLMQKIMYVQKTKIKHIQSEEFALHIKDPSYPINKISWMIDTNIPIKYIRILIFDSAPGGLASAPSVLATSKKKKKEEREDRLF